MRYEKKELDYSEAKEKALRLLEFRSHSEAELKNKLVSAGAAEEIADRVLDFLREYSLVNDTTYAQRLASDLSHLKKYGRRRIISELLRRGIDREICEQAADQIDTEEYPVLLELMEKKLGGDTSRKSRDRAFRYFAARGYSFDDIRRAFEEAAQNCITDE